VTGTQNVLQVAVMCRLGHLSMNVAEHIHNGKFPWQQKHRPTKTVETVMPRPHERYGWVGDCRDNSLLSYLRQTYLLLRC
jgi:hypothetical protein